MLSNRGFPLGAKGRFAYFAWARSLMLYGSETWPSKEEDAIRPERNNESMVRWVCNVRPEVSIFVEELRTKLELKSMMDC